MQTLSIRTQARCQLIDVTEDVRRAVREAGLRDGHVICYVPHTTAGITIQENADPDVVHDFLLQMERMVPRDPAGFRHGEGNSDAHIKASLTGLSQTVLVRDGRPVLGTWQGIYFCEYDGPRQRNLLVHCVHG